MFLKRTYVAGKERWSPSNCSKCVCVCVCPHWKRCTTATGSSVNNVRVILLCFNTFKLFLSATANYYESFLNRQFFGAAANQQPHCTVWRGHTVQCGRVTRCFNHSGAKPARRRGQKPLYTLFAAESLCRASFPERRHQEPRGVNYEHVVATDNIMTPDSLVGAKCSFSLPLLGELEQQVGSSDDEALLSLVLTFNIQLQVSCRKIISCQRIFLQHHRQVPSTSLT